MDSTQADRTLVWRSFRQQTAIPACVIVFALQKRPFFETQHWQRRCNVTPLRSTEIQIPPVSSLIERRCNNVLECVIIN